MSGMDSLRPITEVIVLGRHSLAFLNGAIAMYPPEIRDEIWEKAFYAVSDRGLSAAERVRKGRNCRAESRIEAERKETDGG